jgi:hypothetical protein
VANRFFFEADIPNQLDPDWIPKIAALGWVVTTRDRHMLSPTCGTSGDCNRVLVRFGSTPPTGNSPRGTSLRF